MWIDIGYLGEHGRLAHGEGGGGRRAAGDGVVWGVR